MQYVTVHNRSAVRHVSVAASPLVLSSFPETPSHLPPCPAPGDPHFTVCFLTRLTFLDSTYVLP